MQAFLFYIDDWLSSKNIEMMDAAEERGYLRLLLRAAKEPDCGLPDDDEKLAIMSLLGAQWNKPTGDRSRRIAGETSGTKVRKNFVTFGGRLFNERLLREFKNQERVRASRVENGRLGGRQKKQSLKQSLSDSLATGVANGVANGKQNGTSPSPIEEYSAMDASLNGNAVEHRNLSASDDAGVFELQPPEKKPRPVDAIGIWFEKEFWPIYPRKVDRAEAFKMARKVLPGHKPSAVLGGLKAQLPRFQALIAAGEEGKVPHACTWLRRLRWKDEVKPVVIPNGISRNEAAMLAGRLDNDHDSY